MRNQRSPRVRPGKLTGSPLQPAHQKGCQHNNSMHHLHLNTTSLSPNSFFLALTSRAACNPLQPFQALLDSGSSHSFVNEAFALNNRLKTSYLPRAIPLRMFDGLTTSTIDRTCHLPITFSTGESHTMDLFITKLDEEYSVVLGYDWLTQHNPSIDWVETKITFQDLRKGRTPEKLLSPTPEAMDIHLVSERTMKKLSQETGSAMFLLSPINTLWPAPHWLEARALATDLPEDPLSIIPMEYLEFCDVFSGDKANTLAPHRPYNLKINLEEGAKLFHGPVYSLSPPELSTLREFLEENVKNGVDGETCSAVHYQPK